MGSLSVRKGHIQSVNYNKFLITQENWLPGCCRCKIEVEANTVDVIVGVMELDLFRVTFDDDDNVAVEFAREYSKDDDDKTAVGNISVLDSEIADDDNDGVGNIVIEG